MRVIRLLLEMVLEVVTLPLLVLLSLVSRFVRRSVQIGLGPEPLINNVYHKRALERKGWSAETFVFEVYHITSDFDVRGDLWFGGRFKIVRLLLLYIRALFRYQSLYLYFHGGPLGFTRLLWVVEPLLLKLAGMKTVVMPYGSDVQDLLRTPNLAFRHVLCQQYPGVKWRRRIVALKIDLWTLCSSHVIGGCDWVDYLYHWDTLVPAHFSIDVDQWQLGKPRSQGPLRVLHAPNHRLVKGTDFFLQAIEELQAEGLPIELTLVEKVSNQRVQELMLEADVIADQLIIGWYAMFALEAMAMRKTVICYLRDDLLELYRTAGVLDRDPHPIVSATPATVKERLRELVQQRDSLGERGERSRAYVERYHSTEAIGVVFDLINRQVGL